MLPAAETSLESVLSAEFSPKRHEELTEFCAPGLRIGGLPIIVAHPRGADNPGVKMKYIWSGAPYQNKSVDDVGGRHLRIVFVLLTSLPRSLRYNSSETLLMISPHSTTSIQGGSTLLVARMVCIAPPRHEHIFPTAGSTNRHPITFLYCIFSNRWWICQPLGLRINLRSVCSHRACVSGALCSVPRLQRQHGTSPNPNSDLPRCFGLYYTV